jgi:pimeloyl-ACP methyl ester carboxylesterase
LSLTVASLVFVHGLTGNRRSTWTDKPSKVFWPKDLLGNDALPPMRILSYGYDADIAHFWAMASQNRIGEHAGNLVNALTQIRERTDTERRAIVFVTHSLGGLVTEDALLYSKNSAEPHLQDIINSVSGICFLGTPHCGSDLAGWGSIAGSLFNAVKTVNVDLVNVLTANSEVLARVQREFHGMLRTLAMDPNSALEITCFFEELPVRGAGEVRNVVKVDYVQDLLTIPNRSFQSIRQSSRRIMLSAFAPTTWT